MTNEDPGSIATASAHTGRFESRRQIGLVGTLARVVGGTLAIALPIGLGGLTWLEGAFALVALPLVAAGAAPLVAAAFGRLGPHAPRSCAPGCVLLAVMVAANSALVAPTSANGNVTIWVWLGASMLLSAALGYGGCEVLAANNLVTGRREQIGCILYSPIDRAEANRRGRTSHTPPRASASGTHSSSGVPTARTGPVTGDTSVRNRRSPLPPV